MNDFASFRSWNIQGDRLCFYWTQNSFLVYGHFVRSLVWVYLAWEACPVSLRWSPQMTITGNSSTNPLSNFRGEVFRENGGHQSHFLPFKGQMLFFVLFCQLELKTDRFKIFSACFSWMFFLCDQEICFLVCQNCFVIVLRKLLSAVFKEEVWCHFFIKGATHKFQLARLQEKTKFAMPGTSMLVTSKLESDITHLCVCCSPAPPSLAGPAAWSC